MKTHTAKSRCKCVILRAKYELMDKESYYSSDTTSLEPYTVKPLQTMGCVLMYCIEGRAVVECNFSRMRFRKGDLAVIFSDTLFSVCRISPGFKVRRFELSETLTDEATFTSAGAMFDWIYIHPVFPVPQDRSSDIDIWVAAMDWVDKNADAKYRTMMLRNLCNNFFLGLESVLKNQLTDDYMKTISSSRRLLNDFCKLLSENCKLHHDVKFYADKLCITPYYLSRITSRTIGLSPKALIDSQIMVEIKTLLTTTEISIKEIADMYNFESSSYLGRYFRRHIGMTPSDFREMRCRSGAGG